MLMAIAATTLAGRSVAAQISLSNLLQTYDGNPKTAAVITVPAGLSHIITYAGSATPPTNSGSYPVVATVVDPGESGSVSGTLVIGKSGQTIILEALAAQTYGDGPFTVTATANSGLPVTRWESSDPAVATISPDGLVTLRGAGQTSIIASNTGSTNFNATWAARPLNVAPSLASLPSGTQTVTYDGTVQGLDPAVLPSGWATEITYRDTRVAEADATPQVVFQNGPDTLDLSYFSTGLQAVGYWGLAKYASLGGTACKLESCDVTLVSWARYDTHSTYGFLPWANAHPELVVPPKPGISVPGDSGGYHHPITLSFYEYLTEGPSETYRLLTSKTVQAFIPWRPAQLSTGAPYPYNGYAFRIPFSFADGVILPRNVWVAVSFNTHSFGEDPVGISGPYDALNIARPAGQQAGSTQLSSYSLPFKDWRWQSSSGGTGPMLRLRAIPATANTDAPLNSANYEAKTHEAASGETSTSLLVINKAPLAVDFTHLTQIRDGSPKPVNVTTSPVGVPTTVTYGGSPMAPSGLGSYPVTATSANPNFEGQANATLQIGDSFASWQSKTFASTDLPPEQMDDIADPDGDGISNFLEYAFNLNPISSDQSPQRFDRDGKILAFTYSRNPHAFDLDYAIEGSGDFAEPMSWAPVTPIRETTISDDGSTRVIHAQIAEPEDLAQYFLRLVISR